MSIENDFQNYLRAVYKNQHLAVVTEGHIKTAYAAGALDIIRRVNEAVKETDLRKAGEQYVAIAEDVTAFYRTMKRNLDTVGHP